jgi:hypothetical protein
MKMTFRPLLLDKMLKVPRAKDTPLRDAVQETFHCVSTESIPSYVRAGWRALEEDAKAILAERGEK